MRTTEYSCRSEYCWPLVLLLTYLFKHDILDSLVTEQVASRNPGPSVGCRTISVRNWSRCPMYHHHVTCTRRDSEVLASERIFHGFMNCSYEIQKYANHAASTVNFRRVDDCIDTWQHDRDADRPAAMHEHDPAPQRRRCRSPSAASVFLNNRPGTGL